MGLVSVSKSYGVLYRLEDKTRVEYEVYEVSEQSLGVLISENFTVGDGLVLETYKNGLVPLMVLSNHGSDPASGGKSRYKLMSLHQETELHRLLDYDVSFERNRSTQSGQSVQFARFLLDEGLDVLTKTFGSMETYRLQGVDISKTGMLLCAKNSWDVAPFIEQTLLEIKLDISNQFSVRPIEPLGKVVRSFCKGKLLDQVRYYAIQFTDFSASDVTAWNELISRIEAESLHRARLAVAA